ncbi:hypothetical protein, partial [Agrobacterium pusense]|uniref:hypothetical protein n=1 Tax=Agrobacterium pusense TaxID=648995 RepID=UPI0028A20657
MATGRRAVVTTPLMFISLPMMSRTSRRAAALNIQKHQWVWIKCCNSNINIVGFANHDQNG